MNAILPRANMLLRANQLQIGEHIYIEPNQMYIDYEGNMYVGTITTGSQYPPVSGEVLILIRNEVGYLIDLTGAQQYEWVAEIVPKRYRTTAQELDLKNSYIKIDGIVE